MAKIRVLPDTLANKIAAGEVVERPASVVKELLENALDAGARSVNIEVESGGKRLIRVIDDGEGMTRDDAIVAFERHATSKLRSAEDLETITTLGFRGEALPSIASVSRLHLRTKTAADVEGTEVEFNGGRLAGVRDIAWPGGTEIEVKDLFFNMPARKKFLKSDATETYHITNLVQHYALANSALSFLLINNGRDAIRVAPARSLKERAYQILGGALLNKLLEVKAESDGLRIEGFVSNPQEQRSSRDQQYLFVNRRFVRDQLIGRAISEAYRAMMPSGTYPAVVLFIEAPPVEVDVNVHPAKTEVRFLHEGNIVAFVRNAVAEAIRATEPTTRIGINRGETDVTAPRSQAPAAPPRNPRSGTGASATWQPLSKEPRNDATPGVREESAGEAIRLSVSHRATPPAPASSDAPAGDSAFDQVSLDGESFSTLSEDAGGGAQDSLGANTAEAGADVDRPLLDSLELFTDAAAGESQPAQTPAEAEAHQPQALPDMGHGIKPLGQIRDSYIVATDEEGLLLVDQHVAHERVLFEQFRDTRLARPADVQALLIPETLDLSPAEADAFGVVQEELESIGVETMQLSGRTVAIKTAPAGLAAKDVIALVREALGVVERERRSFSLDHLRDEIAASLACKAAIKVNMRLTSEKMQWLIDELMKTQNPMTCPHGRPIIMRMDLRDIERGFKRPV
ncbi:MAG TPA: DNA mismatch repair endonuclease MutL [Blastocatellia bacterium]|nr:DNA mismatch repair endonuclease MutL [Blastocatellia bacterium]